MITSSTFGKALQGGKMKKKPTQTLAVALKKDKAIDATMTPAMMKSDIKADKQLLAQKVKKGKK